MNRPNDEYRVLISELRRVLKQRRYTYKTLAKQMGMSEAGVKRIFLKADGKVSTVAKICDLLGFGFADLVASSRLGKVEVRYLNEEQDSFFAKNFHVYVFFNELVIRRKDIPTIQEEHGLSSQSVRKYLQMLERIDLIEIRSVGTVKLKIKEPVGLSKNGRLRSVLQRNFIQSVADQLIDVESPKGEKLLHTREWTLSRDNLASLGREIQKLIEQYDRIGARDYALLEPTELITVNLLAGATSNQPPYPKIPNL